MNIKIFCICIHNNILNKIKKLNYIPVGLGSDEFSPEWITDKTGENIAHKNNYYGEYTFHYWFWKNFLPKFQNNEWIGFCAYRRYWSNKKNIEKDKINNIYDHALKDVPEEWNDYEVILGDHMKLDYINWMKVIKYGKKAFLKNPYVIKKSKRNIKFHFDMFHGVGILDKAIDLLDDNNREDFRKFVYEKTSYNQGNMFITKSKEIMNNYYKTIFSWLEKCEKEFGFELEGYGKKRIYAFLAERFLPFWFKKNYKTMDWPIFFYDIRKE